MEEEIVAAGTDTQKLNDMFKGKVKTVYFDFSNKDTYFKALENVDRVFLMRPPHLGKPEALYPFMDAMKSRSIKLVSFLSLMGVEKNTIPPHHKIDYRKKWVGLLGQLRICAFPVINRSMPFIRMRKLLLGYLH